jgi:hypothetical protein
MIQKVAHEYHSKKTMGSSNNNTGRPKRLFSHTNEPATYSNVASSTSSYRTPQPIGSINAILRVHPKNARNRAG